MDSKEQFSFRSTVILDKCVVEKDAIIIQD